MKSALIRIDLNIPLGCQTHPKISTLEKILQHYTKQYEIIILCSHLGQPSENDDKLSFHPFIETLTAVTGFKIEILGSFEKPKKPGIYLLENIRFDKREYDACDSLLTQLEQLSDQNYFEALACCHRKHCSIYNLTHSPKTKIGILAEKELQLWRKIKSETKTLYLVGGAKAKTKIPFIEKLSKSNQVYVFGALAHCYLHTKQNIASSFIPQYKDNLNDHKIYLPKDFKWQSGYEKDYSANVPRSQDDYIVDIAKDSITDILKAIDLHELVIWLGPSCWFEKIQGQSSIHEIMNYLIQHNKKFFIGGGETAQVVSKHYPEHHDKIFDAGGALLAYLSDSPIYLPAHWLTG